MNINVGDHIVVRQDKMSIYQILDTDIRLLNLCKVIETTEYEMKVENLNTKKVITLNKYDKSKYLTANEYVEWIHDLIIHLQSDEEIANCYTTNMGVNKNV